MVYKCVGNCLGTPVMGDLCSPTPKAKLGRAPVPNARGTNMELGFWKEHVLERRTSNVQPSSRGRGTPSIIFNPQLPCPHVRKTQIQVGNVISRASSGNGRSNEDWNKAAERTRDGEISPSLKDWSGPSECYTPPTRPPESPVCRRFHGHPRRHAFHIQDDSSKCTPAVPDGSWFSATDKSMFPQK